MEARRTDARVAAMVAAHGEALRAGRPALLRERGGRGEDAVQRGLEIYVRRLGRVDPATELAWLKVVVRHEALAVGVAAARRRAAARSTSTPTRRRISGRSTSSSRAASARAASRRRSAGSSPTRRARCC